MKFTTIKNEFKSVIDEINDDEIIVCKSERFGEDIKSYPVETYDFIKYCKQSDINFQIRLEDENETNAEILHSNDIWLPVFYLASQVSMNVIVSLITDYLKFKFGKNYETYDNSIHFKVRKISVNGELKEVEYNGPTSEMSDEMLKFDINKFFED